VEQALHCAFLATDQDFISDEDSDHIGTTAVAAVVSSSALWLANAGDSRAIVCRAGAPVAATSDHNTSRCAALALAPRAGVRRGCGAGPARCLPSALGTWPTSPHPALPAFGCRQDEVARIVAGGGRIKGGRMVLGALPMTRAIGDQRLRPHVIPDPEVRAVQCRQGRQARQARQAGKAGRQAEAGAALLMRWPALAGAARAAGSWWCARRCSCCRAAEQALRHRPLLLLLLLLPRR
jgi:hypothetical protein